MNGHSELVYICTLVCTWQMKSATFLADTVGTACVKSTGSWQCSQSSEDREAAQVPMRA